jgi:hypothetical protein
MNGLNNRGLEIKADHLETGSPECPGNLYIWKELYKICIVVYIINMAISEASATESISLR